MRNLLAFVGGVVLVVGGLGLYLGWYKIQKEPSADPGTSRWQVEVDQNKFHQDAQKAIQAVQQKLTTTTGPARPATTAPAPTTGPKPPTSASHWRPGSFWP